MEMGVRASVVLPLKGALCVCIQLNFLMIAVLRNVQSLFVYSASLFANYS